ncbi:hypothetical protein MRX96_007881 [Rhipicephalus microplus]
MTSRAAVHVHTTRREEHVATSDEEGALDLQQLDEPAFPARSIPFFCGFISRVSVLNQFTPAKERSYNVAQVESHISTHAIAAATDKPLEENNTARGSKFPAGATRRPHITRLEHAHGAGCPGTRPPAFFVSLAEHSSVGVELKLRLERARTWRSKN